MIVYLLFFCAGGTDSIACFPFGTTSLSSPPARNGSLAFSTCNGNLADFSALDAGTMAFATLRTGKLNLPFDAPAPSPLEQELPVAGAAAGSTYGISAQPPAAVADGSGRVPV
jgi:hypothetical protein